ncbi:MAG: glutamate-5-semialdehyde dehydrogenase [Patescibacteria group bacterium]
MDLISQASAAKRAARAVAKLSTEAKNSALKLIADKIRANKAEILEANALDIKAGKEKGLGPMIDRLKLTEERIDSICDECMNVASLEDQVGKIIDESERPNGLVIQRVRCPLGVIGMIYESRPNVTVDATVLCLKSGNSVMLRGGSDAINSNRALVKLIKEALAESEIPEDAVQFLDSTDRSVVSEFLKLTDYLDVIIPRGGKGLIKHVTENAHVPVIQTGASVVHIYVDESADIEKSIPVIVNSKTRRVSICNALDTLLVHSAVADKLLSSLAEQLKTHNVEIRACERSYPILEGYEKLAKLTDEDLDTEFLDYIMAVKIVDSLDEALDHIAEHSLKHSEAILAENKENAERFLKEVDSACVFWNAATQFSDGAQFGLGAEIGISTQKLHVRGPFALEGLTSFKWTIKGDGQTRPV